jgi:hypothetical protein
MYLKNQNKIKLKLSLFNYKNLDNKMKNSLLSKMLNLNLKIHQINYPNLSKTDFNNLKIYYSKIPYELTIIVEKLIKNNNNKIKKIEEKKILGIIEILKVDISEKINDLNKSAKLTSLVKDNFNNLYIILKSENFETIESVVLLFTVRNYLEDFQYKIKTFEHGMSLDSSIKNLSLFKQSYKDLLGYIGGWMLESLDSELLLKNTNAIVKHLDYMDWFQNPKTRNLMSMDLELKINNEIFLIDVKNYLINTKNILKLSFHKDLEKMSKNLTKNYVYNRNSSYMYSFFNKKKNTIDSYFIPFKIMKDFIKYSLKENSIKTEEHIIKISNNKFKEIFSEFKLDFNDLNLSSYFIKKLNLKSNNIQISI